MSGPTRVWCKPHLQRLVGYLRSLWYPWLSGFCIWWLSGSFCQPWVGSTVSTWSPPGRCFPEPTTEQKQCLFFFTYLLLGTCCAACIRISEQTQNEWFPLKVVSVLKILKMCIDKDAFKTWCIINKYLLKSSVVILAHILEFGCKTLLLLDWLPGFKQLPCWLICLNCFNCWRATMLLCVCVLSGNHNQ